MIKIVYSLNTSMGWQSLKHMPVIRKWRWERPSMTSVSSMKLLRDLWHSDKNQHHETPLLGWKSASNSVLEFNCSSYTPYKATFIIIILSLKWFPWHLFPPAGDPWAPESDAGHSDPDPDGHVQTRPDRCSERHPHPVRGHRCQEHRRGWRLVQVQGKDTYTQTQTEKTS